MSDWLRRAVILFLACLPYTTGCGQPDEPVRPEWAATPGSDTLPVFERSAEGNDSVATFTAPNPPHGFVTQFLAHGIEVEGGEGPGAWRLGLRTTRFGRAGDLAPVEPTTPSRTHEGIEYRRNGLVEWYINRAPGLEQGYRIDSRPTGEGEVVIELQSAGSLTPVALEGGGVGFVADARTPVLFLDQLHVIDSSESVVPARLAVADNDIVEIRIADTGFNYPLLVDPMLTSTYWGDGITGLPDGTGLGYAVASGDVNDDGFNDVIVSSVCQALAAGGCENHVDVYLGTQYVGGGTGVEASPSWSATGDSNEEQFGWDVASADVNDDGFDDVIVGAPFFYGTCTNSGLRKGRVLIWYGGPSDAGAGDPTGLGADGTVANADELLTPGLNAFRCSCPDNNRCSSTAGFGGSIATGDLNNDGVGDMVVGDPDRFSFEFFPDTREGFGEITIYFGAASGGMTDQGDHTAELCIRNPLSCGGVRFGTDLAVGDITGDGRDDIAVTAPGDSDVYLFEGADFGVSRLGGRIGVFAQSVAIADTDFDGYGDLIVGGSNFAQAYSGGPTGVTASGWTYAGQTWGSFPDIVEEAFGQSATGLGDTNGDCYEDVVIGAPRWPGPVPLNDEAAGRVYVFEGSASGLGTTPASDFNGAFIPQARYGWDLEPFSFDGGRQQDLLSGSPFANFERGVVDAHVGSGAPVVVMTPNPLMQVDQDDNPWQVEYLPPLAGSTTNLRLRITALADFANVCCSVPNAIAFDSDVLALDAPTSPAWVVERHGSPSFSNFLLVSYTSFFDPPNNGEFIEFTVTLDVEPTEMSALAASVNVPTQTSTFSGGPIADCDGDGSPRELDCDDARASIEPGATEICDGLDNDCDHVYDEGFAVGDSCSVGFGVCEQFGTVRCDTGGGSSSCDAIPLTGSPEICDLLDNDCDGSTDEVQDLGQTTCGLGACNHTVNNCVGGVTQICDPLAGAMTEICNGVDDDCNGPVDNDIDDIIAGSDVGQCQPQIESCLGGSFQIVQTAIGPTAEICDGIDNDCNGDDDVAQGICNSPPGGDATVTDPTGEVSVTLPGVTVGGDTTITQIACSDLIGVSGLAIPGDPNSCIDVTTTADWAGGQAVVCMSYEDNGTCSISSGILCTSDASCPPTETCVDPAEDDLTIVRFPDTGPPPVELTFVSQDFVDNIICASTPEFSGFAVGVLLDTDIDFTVDIRDNCPNDFNFFQDDGDFDGAGDACDNCANIANARLAGSCISSDPASLGITCSDNADCLGLGLAFSYCSRSQEDSDANEIGTACDPTEVPEPGFLPPLMLGALALGEMRRRRRHAAKMQKGRSARR